MDHNACLTSIAFVLVFLLSIPGRAQQPIAAPVAANDTNDTNDLEKFAGIYELSRGQYIYIQPWPGGGGQLTYSDDLGVVRSLFPDSENRFSAGPGMLVRAPAQFTLNFIPDSKGKVSRLIYQRAGLPQRTAKKLESYKREPIRFRSGTERLAGVLLIPPGKGPFPALVLIHGTGPTDRNTVFPIVQFLLSHGVALLGYDKRGVGESTGDWHAASMDELAADAASAVQLLKTRKDIDPRRIGVFGASQGGWVAPLAASRSPDIAFVIMVSGPGVSPAEVDRDLLERALRERGFARNEIDRALDFMRLRDATVGGEKSFDSFQAAFQIARGEKWFPYSPLPRSLDHATFEHWSRLPLGYNPAPAIEKLRVPALALFGGLDHTVDPTKNSAAWRAAFDRGGVKDTTIQMFPRGNHMLLESRTGTNDELPLLDRFVPAYSGFLLDWLQKHGIVRK